MNGPPATPLEVGGVLGPHGLAGQVRLQVFNRDSPLWAPGNQVYLASPGKTGRWLELKAIRIKGGQAVATFSGIESLAAAEALRGATLLADRRNLGAEGEIFLADLLGLRLVDSAGRELGRLTEVRQSGNLEFFVVEGPVDILLPTHTQFASVDLTRGVAKLGFTLEPESN